MLSYWERGSGQLPEAGPHTSPTSYVVDHLGRCWNRSSHRLLGKEHPHPRIRSLLKKAGGTFFEDSLELETHSTLWTPSLLKEFSKQMGYDLLPYLPVVIELKEKYQFTYDPDETTRVRDDLNQVLSNLYRDNHLLPLRDWANKLGLRLRIQAYGIETDTLEFSGLLDVPSTTATTIAGPPAPDAADL